MNSQTEAAAFRIWQYCELHGWDFYPSQLAERLNIPQGRVNHVIDLKGWRGKLPVMTKSSFAKEAAIYSVPQGEASEQELRFE